MIISGGITRETVRSELAIGNSSPIIISRGSSTICEPTGPNRGISRQSIRTKSKNSARLGAHTWKNSESWPRVVTENPKPEGRNPKEIRSPSSGEPSLLPAHGKFGDCPATHSDLGIRVSFGLRISAFGFGIVPRKYLTLAETV